MHQNAAGLLAAGSALLLGTLVPSTGATPLHGEPLKLYRDLLKRDPPAALPQSASDDELKWQPSLDFDTDGCYNTPAIDADGNVAEGLDQYVSSASSTPFPSLLHNSIQDEGTLLLTQSSIATTLAAPVSVSQFEPARYQ